MERSVLNVTFKLPLRFPLEPAKQLFRLDVLFAFRSLLEVPRLVFNGVWDVGDVANRLDKLVACCLELGLCRLVIDFAT